ncbi:endonuclease/exonuclease/phosphatase family protein [Seongchinamella unica]|nr:endonuclease/exonuclease/phosphatase family protein [Seongchinamella unica]
MNKMLAGAMSLLLLSCNTIRAEEPRQQPLTVQHNDSAAIAPPGEILRVATLNIAHGRGQSLNQLLVSTEDIAGNLDRIAQFLRSKSIHIAALQEVDSPSAWSGNIDQANVLARIAGYPWWVQASHASLWIARYGTAILSTLPIPAAVSLDFSPSPPTAGKGFTLAQIEWDPGAGETVMVDVISIHMDFSRESVRRAQLDELAALMNNRQHPVILMGDFNSETLAASLMASAAENQRHLNTWVDDKSELFTYKKKRLDWIIVSDELEFVSYTTAQDLLSDHKAVIAELRLADQ